MPRSTLLATATIPDTRVELKLVEHRDRFAISIPGRGELMNSRSHGSEVALAELARERLGERAAMRWLIGGLGMGFTLAAALRVLGEDAEVVVAELVPEVVEWNRQWLGQVAGHPLRDRRVTVHIGDVAEPIRTPAGRFDAILLDVDNGPEALIRVENNWLYSPAGLNAARAALRPGGVLAVWSASGDERFSKRLRACGFEVEAHEVRAHRAGKGARHWIWLCR
ncbi:MAG: hypothetical protein RQ729_11880 [Wenzhouxiangellaceae bacterium]|nr:hypothetical protein [Wenzhouxiangellaceae bacterium]